MKNDDPKWIEHVIAGDEDAFTALVKKYEKQIHAFVWRMVKDYHIAEEITQDTFLRAYEKLCTLRDPNRFSGWLYMIATRRSLTWLGEKRIPMQSLEAMREAEIESLFYAQYMAEQTEKLATEKQREVVKRLLQKLPARERTAVVLHYLSEMTCEEISDFLDVSPNTVKSQLHRARRRLKKEASMVHETLGDFQRSGDLMEDIMNWIQMNEPGVRRSVNVLSATSENTLYVVIGGESIYKLPAGEEAWQFVNADFLRQDTHGTIPIAERDGTLYIIPSDELFASTDGGVTWHSMGSCPKGYTQELIVTEDTFYLCLSEGIFQSNDAGNSWEAMNDGLENGLVEHSGIQALQRYHGTLFIGTSVGLYRLNAETWEPLQLPVDNIVWVRALAVSKDYVYIAAVVNILEGPETSEENFKPLWNGEKRSWWILRSIDGGDSWTDITPADPSNLMGILPRITLLAAGKTLLVIGTDDGVVARSHDSGNTWISPELSGITPMQFSVRNAVALNENTFYTGGSTGIHRSTDGGKTWHRFNTRFESRVDSLASFTTGTAPNTSTVLYATVGPNLVKSTNGGRSWDAIGVASETKKRQYKEAPACIVQVVETDGVLYAKAVGNNTKTVIFRLSADGHALSHPAETPPSFDSVKLMCHVLGGQNFPFKDRRQLGQGFHIALSSEIEPLSNELIHENPDFGAESFLKQLIQVQADAPLAYELMWEGLWGSFAVSGETFYMEYNYKLFRWEPGETEWFYTGVEETIELTRDNVWRGFKIVASRERVYVGKRDGHLLQSLDGGDSWNDITPNFPFSVEHFKEIIFADSIIHVATDKGVIRSKDGITWNVLTDKTKAPLVIKSFATADNSIYGASDAGIYRLRRDIGVWEQVAPEISGVVTSLVVDEDMFYVGTEQRGVLRFKRSN